MFVFRKIWRTLFSWNTRFEIRPFALLPTKKALEQFFDNVYFIVKRTRLESLFRLIIFLHQNVKLTMEEINGELEFLLSTLYILFTSLYTLHFSFHHQTSCKESVVSSSFNRTYFIITNKDNLNKRSASIKQVLEENGYQENIISKIFKRIANNHSLPRSQK